MIRKLLISLLMITASFFATADVGSRNVPGVSYQLANAIKIAQAAVGEPERKTKRSSNFISQWFGAVREPKAGSFQWLASFKGGYQFGRQKAYEASQAERLGFESRGGLMKGLRVGGRVRF